MITQLTPEQEALIPVTLQKWRGIALSTESIDRPHLIPSCVQAIVDLLDGGKEKVLRLTATWYQHQKRPPISVGVHIPSILCNTDGTKGS